MEIPNVESFLSYYERLRERTSKVALCISTDRIEWSYAAGKFTLGDILRHVAAIERYMYAENAQFKPSRYPGHGRKLADGYEAIFRFFDKAHEESMNIFRGLAHEQLRQKCVTPAGASLRETGLRMCPPEKSRDSDPLRCRAVRSLQSGLRANNGEIRACFAYFGIKGGGNSLQLRLAGGGRSLALTFLRPNSLLTGKITGNLRDFDPKNRTTIL